MKKQSLAIAVVALLGFASCQESAPVQEGPTQEQLDSAAKAQEEQMRAEMQAQNDSLIAAEAQRKADSIAAEEAAKNSKGTSKTKTTKAPVKQTPAVKSPEAPKEEIKAAPINSKDTRFNGKTNTINKDARFDEGAAQKLKEENSKKKEDRFK